MATRTREDMIAESGTLIEFITAVITHIDKSGPVSDAISREEAISNIADYINEYQSLPQREGLILTSSIVSRSTQKPLVDYRWDDKRVQWTPEEAQAHALVILACAEAAIMDAAVIEFLKKRMDLDWEKAAAFVHDLRNFREDMKKEWQ